MADTKGRATPVLTSAISFLLGAESLVGLLNALHIVHFRVFQLALPQTVTYHVLHSASLACILLGCVFLWRLHRPAPWLLLTGFCLAAVAGTIENKLLLQEASPASAIEAWVFFVLIYGWIVIYSWWETRTPSRAPAENTL